MIIRQYYLSDKNNLCQAEIDLEIGIKEIEAIVGRFNSNSHREGQLRGKVVEHSDGRIELRHHFNNKVLWEV